MKRGRLLTITLAAALAVGVAHADEGYIELLRSDLRADKVMLITATMKLTEEEGTAFWPIYREYDVELSAISDKRVAMIKDYAMNFTTMSDEKASELAERFFKHRENRLKIMKKYHKKIASAVSQIRAAQFIQLENQIAQMIDVQISGEIPLIQRGKVIAKD
jgi:predicted GH43/DUF377 family glycosyl hydrolase